MVGKIKALFNRILKLNMCLIVTGFCYPPPPFLLCFPKEFTANPVL